MRPHVMGAFYNRLLFVVVLIRKNPDARPGFGGETELTAVAKNPQQHQEQVDEVEIQR